jgi:hypothetical protein
VLQKKKSSSQKRKMMKTLFSEIIVCWCFFALAKGQILLPQFSNGESSSCKSLVSEESEESVGSFCLRLYPASSPDKVSVEYAVRKQGWILQDAKFWIGANETDSPVTTTSEKINIDESSFSFAKKSIHLSVTSFRLSLMEDFGFDCSNGKTDFFATAQATIRRRESMDSNDRTSFIQKNEESGNSQNPFVIPFGLSCSKSSNDSYTDSFSDNGTMKLQDHRHMREACGIQPRSSRRNFGMSKDFLLRSYTAMKLIRLVTEGDTDDPNHYKVYENFFVYSDLYDKALVVKTQTDAMCYGVFRGTQFFNPLDHYQNLIPLTSAVPNSDCVVRQGFQQAYFSSYVDQFRFGLDTCVQSCPGGCPVILTGHGQGGAIAVVASIDLRAYNPTVSSEEDTVI